MNANYTPELNFNNDDKCFDPNDIESKSVLILKTSVRKFKKHNSSMVVLPVGVQSLDRQSAHRMYIELKNVRMWAPNAKESDAGEFRHYGTEILLHDTPIEEDSLQYQRALSLERIGNTVCDIMQDSGDISTKRKSLDELRERFAKKTHVKGEDDQYTDDVDESKSLKIPIKFGGNRKKKTVQGDFFVKTGPGKVRKVGIEYMLEMGNVPVNVERIVFAFTEVYQCGLGYYPQFVVCSIVMEDPSHSGSVVMPKKGMLPAGYSVEEDEEEDEEGATLDEGSMY